MGWTSIFSGLLTFLGSGAFLTGLTCIVSSLTTGDHHVPWQTCLALIASGGAVASPGLNALKTGIFSRPAPQQTKDPLTSERR